MRLRRRLLVAGRDKKAARGVVELSTKMLRGGALSEHKSSFECCPMHSQCSPWHSGPYCKYSSRASPLVPSGSPGSGGALANSPAQHSNEPPERGWASPKWPCIAAPLHEAEPARKAGG